jgi:hypothetical protein
MRRDSGRDGRDSVGEMGERVRDEDAPKEIGRFIRTDWRLLPGDEGSF